MSDPQNFGLDELGQRLQAMGLPDRGPVIEPRLRPYQGAPLPVGQSANGQSQPTPPPSPRAAGNPVPTSQPVSMSGSMPGSASGPFSGSLSGSMASGSMSGSMPAYDPFEAYRPQDTLHIPAPGPIPAQPPISHESPFHTDASLSGSAWPPFPGAEPPHEEAPAAPKALSSPAPSPVEDPNAPKNGFQRAIDAVRSALPVVQRLLPLLDGNFASIVANLVSNQPVHPPPPPVKVDLEPVERGLAELRTGQRDLRNQVQEQVASMKRVEDQLERVREATDRNTLEQQELVEDLRSVGNRISTFAVIGLLLLAISLGLNVYFLVQLQHILR